MLSMNNTKFTSQCSLQLLTDTKKVALTYPMQWKVTLAGKGSD
jgi:hypothetical protein